LTHNLLVNISYGRDPRALVVTATLLFAFLTLTVSSTDDNDPKLIRWKMQRILKEVSQIIEKNYYDAKLNGVNWKSAVEVARKRIDEADHTGEMVAAISGLVARLNDSHTVFIPPGRTEHPHFGFEVKPFGEDAIVYEVMPQGPADLAGLRVGDGIEVVNDFKVTRANIDDMMRYFRLLNPNRTLHLTVATDGTKTRQIVIEAKLKAEVTKDFSRLYNTYERELKQDETPSSREYDSGIVYLKFPSFMVVPHDAGSFVRKAEHASAVILDLRENGGGRQDALLEVAGYFIHEPGDLAESISREKTDALKIKPKKPGITAPLFVLVDSHSASASEMFARSIQLNHRGKIVGDRTSGRVNQAAIYWGPYRTTFAPGRIRALMWRWNSPEMRFPWARTRRASSN